MATVPRLARPVGGSTARGAGSAAGIALLVAGSWLPWYDRVCDRTCILSYVPGMNRGIEAGGMVVLPLAVLAAVGLLAGIRVVGSRPYRTAVGGVAVAVAGTALYQHPPVGTGLRAAVGVYLTFLGGLLLLSGGVPAVARWAAAPVGASHER